MEDIHQYSLIVFMVYGHRPHGPQPKLYDRLLCLWHMQSVQSKNYLYV